MHPSIRWLSPASIQEIAVYGKESPVGVRHRQFYLPLDVCFYPVLVASLG
jgi:hypothetical protein